MVLATSFADVIMTWMKRYPTDYLLWTFISVTLWVTIVVVNLVLVQRIGRIDRFLYDIAFEALVCAVVGWIVQALAVICGIRLSGGSVRADSNDPLSSENVDLRQ